MTATRSFAVALLALALAGCDDSTAPRRPRQFDIVSVNGSTTLSVACPPAGAGGVASVGFDPSSSLTLYPTGRFEWGFTVGSFEELGGMMEVHSMTTLEQGAYRVRGDSLLLTFGVSMPLTEAVGTIDGSVVELFVTQECSTDPAFPGAPLRVRLEEVERD